MDLTKITTPFGLLDEETKEALKGRSGPIQIYQGGNSWDTFANDEKPLWFDFHTYRVKPQPLKPREWWIAGHLVYYTKKEAIADDWDDEDIIHVREVPE